MGQLLLLLQSFIFQLSHKLYIKLPYIEFRDIFSVEVYHITVGNSSLTLNSEKCVFSPHANEVSDTRTSFGPSKSFTRWYEKFNGNFPLVALFSFEPTL